MTERFQRSALIAEAARMESYINQQLGLAIRTVQELPADAPEKVRTRFQTRWDQLERCRVHANQLREMVWDLD